MKKKDLTFAKYLRSCRIERGLKEVEVGKNLGFSSGQFIYNIEAGVASIPPRYLKKIARMYGLDEKKFRKSAFQAKIRDLRGEYGLAETK